MERVFIPVHSGAHWALLVVSPIAHTIEYFDSLGGPASPHILNAKAWLREELRQAVQGRRMDCANGQLRSWPRTVEQRRLRCFHLHNARMVVLGVDPMAYAGSDIDIQRTRMVAELLNGIEF